MSDCPLCAGYVALPWKPGEPGRCTNCGAWVKRGLYVVEDLKDLALYDQEVERDIAERGE